jgi:hypothetical protein
LVSHLLFQISALPIWPVWSKRIFFWIMKNDIAAKMRKKHKKQFLRLVISMWYNEQKSKEYLGISIPYPLTSAFCPLPSVFCPPVASRPPAPLQRPGLLPRRCGSIKEIPEPRV